MTKPSIYSRFIRVQAICNDLARTVITHYIRSELISSFITPDRQMIEIGARAGISTSEGLIFVKDTVEDIIEQLTRINLLEE